MKKPLLIGLMLLLIPLALAACTGSTAAEDPVPAPSPAVESPAPFADTQITVPDDPELLFLLRDFLGDFALMASFIEHSHGPDQVIAFVSADSIPRFEMFYQATGQAFDPLEIGSRMVPLWEAYQALSLAELDAFRALIAAG